MVKLILGFVVATPGALRLAEEYGVSLLALVIRHEHGDWGTLDPEDRRANADALTLGNRVLSCYHLTPNADGPRIWIITEWDRSVTTLLLPEEY